jgi:hypothetical protein
LATEIVTCGSISNTNVDKNLKNRTQNSLFLTKTHYNINVGKIKKIHKQFRGGLDARLYHNGRGSSAVGW